MHIKQMSNKNVNEIFKCLINTIESLSYNNLSDDGIDDVLEELEGDYYTFMHIDNLKILEHNGCITIDNTVLILDLREKIQALPPNLWNNYDFKNSIKWHYIRNDAVKILKEIIR